MSFGYIGGYIGDNIGGSSLQILACVGTIYIKQGQIREGNLKEQLIRLLNGPNWSIMV